jgi:hypothetical protein
MSEKTGGKDESERISCDVVHCRSTDEATGQHWLVRGKSNGETIRLRQFTEEDENQFAAVMGGKHALPDEVRRFWLGVQFGMSRAAVKRQYK